MFPILMMLVFMLIPVWIPLIAVTVGAISDRIRKPAPPKQFVRTEIHRTVEPAMAAR